MDIGSPVVSIICPVYNHGKYIAQTLDGFVTQKTDFPFEIIVHDDASTDNTVVVLKEYEIKYPGLFSNIYQKENQFSKSIHNGSKTTFAKARGKYLTLCEGDDFWNDSYKLQKQVDFLEKNPGYVGCFHNVEERYENDDNKASFLYCDYPESRDLSFGDLSFSNTIPTCSVVFRSKLFEKFPDWFYQLKIGDWPLHLLNAQFGNYWYLPKIMAVHRIHTQSYWTLQGDQRNKQYLLEAYDIMIEGFSDKKDLQRQLMNGKKNFEANMKQPGIFKRGINFVKRLTNE